MRNPDAPIGRYNRTQDKVEWLLTEEIRSKRRGEAKEEWKEEVQESLAEAL